MNISMCFLPCIDENRVHSFPVHFDCKNHAIKMTGASVENDVALFVASLLNFNELNLDNEFFEALKLPDVLALSGGLIFEECNSVIAPSCCSDFQDWPEVIEMIRKRAPVWLGHDPTPYFEYDGDDIILWSDEEQSEERYALHFEQNCVTKCLPRIFFELNQFTDLVSEWADKYCPENRANLLRGMQFYLGTRSTDFQA